MLDGRVPWRVRVLEHTNPVVLKYHPLVLRIRLNWIHRHGQSITRHNFQQQRTTESPRIFFDNFVHCVCRNDSVSTRLSPPARSLLSGPNGIIIMIPEDLMND